MKTITNSSDAKRKFESISSASASAQYHAQKTTPNGCEYILTIPYENDEDLDKQVWDLFREMDWQADMDYCFIEVDAQYSILEKGGELLTNFLAMFNSP